MKYLGVILAIAAIGSHIFGMPDVGATYVMTLSLFIMTCAIITAIEDKK